MWKWIVEQVDLREDIHVNDLKVEFLKKHHFTKELISDCFFCEYDHLRDCAKCPACLVDPDFNCLSRVYGFSEKPQKFYRKLLELNDRRNAALKAKVNNDSE